MDWIKVNRADYEKSKLMNEKRRLYSICLSPRAITPTEEENFDTEVLIVRNLLSISTADIQEQLLNLQKEYDNSDEVNSFVIADSSYWLDKATRVGLVNSINVKKAVGADSIELWMGSQKLTVDLEYAEQFLNELELYAMQCYNVTAEHLAEIQAMNDRGELFEYDITKGYPEKISFDLSKLVG